jgi:hypothetical protein
VLYHRAVSARIVRARPLRFVLRLAVAGIDYRDPVARARPWLGAAAKQLSPRERRQLWACVFARQRPLAEVLAGDYDYFARSFCQMAEVPLEWWYVFERGAKQPLYELFLFAADGGVLVKAGTARIVGRLIQFGWHGDAALGAQLGAARRRIAKRARGTALATYELP